MLKSFFYLYLREITRFIRIPGQTLIGPIVTILLFVLVFSVSISNRISNLPLGVSFISFLIPGLMMMQVIQGSFANSSSSILMSKLFGAMNDLLMAPINEHFIVLAYALSSVTRGLMIIIATFLISYVILGHFIDLTVISSNLFISFVFVIIGSFLMGLVGIICGLWSTGFDKLASITNLIVVPLSFLSGTFYSINAFPHIIKSIIYLNPIFYMIDGFRSGFISHSDYSIANEISIIMILNVILYFYSVRLFKKGYNTRS